MPMIIKNLCSNPPNLPFGSNSGRGKQPWLFGRLFWHHSVLKLFPKEGGKRAYGEKHGVTDEHVIAPMAVALSQAYAVFTISTLQLNGQFLISSSRTNECHSCIHTDRDLIWISAQITVVLPSWNRTHWWLGSEDGLE